MSVRNTVPRADEFFPTPPVIARILFSVLDHHFDLKEDDEFLDLGVGAGALSSQFSSRGYTVDGLDCNLLTGVDVRNYHLMKVPPEYTGFPSDDQAAMASICLKYDYIVSNPPFKLLDDFVFWAHRAKKGCAVIAPYKQLLATETLWTHIYQDEMFRQYFGVTTPICIAVWDPRDDYRTEPYRTVRHPTPFTKFTGSEDLGVILNPNILSYIPSGVFVEREGGLQWIHRYDRRNPPPDRVTRFTRDGKRHRKGELRDLCFFRCDTPKEVEEVYASFVRSSSHLAEMLQFYLVTDEWSSIREPVRPVRLIGAEEIIPGGYLIDSDGDCSIVLDWMSIYRVKIRWGDSVPLADLIADFDILVWNGREIPKSQMTSAFFYFRLLTEEDLSWEAMIDFLDAYRYPRHVGYGASWRSVLEKEEHT